MPSAQKVHPPKKMRIYLNPSLSHSPLRAQIIFLAHDVGHSVMKMFLNEACCIVEMGIEKSGF